MRRFFLFLSWVGLAAIAVAADTVFVKEARVPVLLERQDNVLFYLRIPARESRVLDGVTLDLSDCDARGDIAAVKLYGIIHFNLANLYITKIRKDVGSRALRPT